jgi:sugar lactone lactonase YvrE
MLVSYRLFLLFSSISVLHAQLIVTTVVGGAIRSGVPAENVQLNGTAGITHDPAGNLVFCEHHVIRRLNPDGTIQTIAGTGTSGFSGDGGPAVRAQLQYPASPQYDSKGNLYFIDYGTRIRRVDTIGVITTVAGTGIYGSIGAVGPALTAQIVANSLAIASDDSLYFAESTAIWRLTTAGNIALIAGGPNPKCVGGPAGDGHLCNAHSLAINNSGDLYFVEDNQPGVPNNGEDQSYIYRVSSTGAVTPFAGFGNTASALPAGGPAMQAVFLAISAIVLDSSGNMYVASSVDVSQLLNFYPSIQRVSEIDRISSADGTVKTIAGQATSPSPYEGPALQAYLGIVSGLVLNNDGSIVFSSINTIGELTKQSTVQLLAGRNVQLPPDGQQAGLSWLSLPVSVQMAASRSGNFYFSDHCTIRKVGANGLLATVAGTGNCASSVPKTFGPNVDLPPISVLAADSHDNIFVGMGSGLYSLGAGDAVSAIAGISYPAALAVDSQDRVYVVESFGNGLYRIAPDQTVTSLRWNPLPIGFQWLIARGISIDSSDNVYLLNVYQLDNGYIVYRFTPDGSGNPVANLGLLTGLPFAADAQGGVWSIELISLEHTEPSSIPIAMSALCCGYSGEGSAVVGAQFQLYPTSTLTNDASGNIYVLDTGNAAIRKISGPPPSKAPVISPGAS